LLPLRIASGSRIAARCQSSTGSSTVDVEVCLLNGVGGGLSTCETCGADTANTRGTAITSGAAQHVKGNYSQLIASTGGQYRFCVFSMHLIISYKWLVDLATGSAQNEVVIVDNLAASLYDSDQIIVPLPLTIASASRIAARCQTADGVNIPFYGILYGCY